MTAFDLILSVLSPIVFARAHTFAVKPMTTDKSLYLPLMILHAIAYMPVSGSFFCSFVSWMKQMHRRFIVLGFLRQNSLIYFSHMSMEISCLLKTSEALVSRMGSFHHGSCRTVPLAFSASVFCFTDAHQPRKGTSRYAFGPYQTS